MKGSPRFGTVTPRHDWGRLELNSGCVSRPNSSILTTKLSTRLTSQKMRIFSLLVFIVGMFKLPCTYGIYDIIFQAYWCCALWTFTVGSIRVSEHTYGFTLYFYRPRVTTLYGLTVPKGRRQTVRYDDGTGEELNVPLGTTACMFSVFFNLCKLIFFRYSHLDSYDLQYPLSRGKITCPPNQSSLCTTPIRLDGTCTQSFHWIRFGNWRSRAQARWVTRVGRKPG